MAYIGQNAEGNFTTTNAKDRFSGDGSTTTFTLSQRGTENNVDVFVNNVRQEPGVAYNIEGNGTSLVFTAAPSTGTNNIYVVNRGPAELSASHPAAQSLEAVDGTFTGDLTVDTDTLHVDSTNNRVGVGTVSPSAALDIAYGDYQNSGAIRVGADLGTNTSRTDDTRKFAAITIPHFDNAEEDMVILTSDSYSASGGSLTLGGGSDSFNAPNLIGFQTSSDGASAGTERMRISAAGELGLGVTSTTGGAGDINMKGNQAIRWMHATNGTQYGDMYVDTSNNMVFRNTSSSTERMRINSSGLVSIAASSGNGYLSVPQAYTGTTSSAVNMHILSSGVFLRSVSSGRYKTGIEDAEMSYAEELYNLRPVYYKSLGTFDNPNHGHWGFIAEEVAEIDPRLCLFKTTEPDLDDDGNVQYDDDGNIVETTLDEPVVEGVQYDRMIPLFLMLLKAEKDKVEALETRIAALEANQ